MYLVYSIELTIPNYRLVESGIKSIMWIELLLTLNHW